MKPTILLLAVLPAAITAPVKTGDAAVGPRADYGSYPPLSDYGTYGSYPGAGTPNPAPSAYGTYGSYPSSYSTYGTYKRAIKAFFGFGDKDE